VTATGSHAPQRIPSFNNHAAENEPLDASRRAGMDDVYFRNAVPEDLPLLKTLADLFGRGDDDSHALRGWMLPVDHGVIAVSRSRGGLGAAWARPYWLENQFGTTEEALGAREVFVGVHPPYQGHGIGTQLVERLLEKLKQDLRVQSAVALPVENRPESTALCQRFNFIKDDEGVWTLILN
jgi:GNAT superfamily N-acetyltransferase